MPSTSTITVKGDGAVLSRIMYIVTLAVRDFVDLWYIKVIQSLQFVSIADFSEFLCKVGTRQKRKIGTVIFSLPRFSLLCVPPARFLQRNCVLRLLTGDILIGPSYAYHGCTAWHRFLQHACMPQYLEGGFGKQFPDDRQNCLHQECVSARGTKTAECAVVFCMASLPVRIPCVLAQATSTNT